MDNQNTVISFSEPKTLTEWKKMQIELQKFQSQFDKKGTLLKEEERKRGHSSKKLKVDQRQESASSRINSDSEEDNLIRKRKSHATQETVTNRLPQSTPSTPKEDKKQKAQQIVLTTAIVKKVEFVTELRKLHNFNSHFIRAGIKFAPDTEDDSNRLQATFKQRGYKFYTYATEAEKQKHIVLKGLPEYSNEEILADIATKGPKPTRVAKLNHGEPPPSGLVSFLVTYASETNLGEVRKIKHVLYTKVRWETYRNPREMTQCHNCQEHQHGTRHCYQDPRCVKCLGSHKTEDCTKKDTDPPQCVNCLGEHPANYTKCPTYLEKLKAVQIKRESRNRKSRARHPAIKENVLQPEDFPQIQAKANHAPEPPTETAAPWANQPERIINAKQKLDESKNYVKEIFTFHEEVKAYVEEIRKLKELMNWGEQRQVLSNLNKKLESCETQKEQLEVFSQAFEYSEKMDENV